MKQTELFKESLLLKIIPEASYVNKISYIADNWSQAQQGSAIDDNGILIRVTVISELQEIVGCRNYRTRRSRNVTSGRSWSGSSQSRLCHRQPGYYITFNCLSLTFRMDWIEKLGIFNQIDFGLKLMSDLIIFLCYCCRFIRFVGFNN